MKKTNKKEFSKMQLAVDAEREKRNLALIDEEVKKHDAVKQALGILANNKVIAYIYADLPHPEYPIGIPCIYQFNTVGCLAAYNDNGEITSEDSEYNQFFHSALWNSLVDNLIKFNYTSKRHGYDKLPTSDPESIKKVLEFMTWFLYTCRVDYSNRAKDVIDNPL